MESEPDDLHRKVRTYLPDTHRLLPQSIDAEKGVISSFLLAGRQVGALCVEKNLTAECFHQPSHAEIFDCLMAAWNDATPLDFILLTQKMRDRGRLDHVGGAAQITELFTFLPTAANAEYYINIVLRKHRRRKLIQVTTEYAARSYEEADDEEDDELIDEFERKALTIRDIRKSARHNIGKLVVESITRIEDTYNRRGEVRGLSYGFHDLDKMTDGMKPEEFIILAARPSHGKTAFALNVADHVAITLKKPIAVFSLEMSASQLVDRLLYSRSRVNYFRIRDGFLAERDFPALQVAASAIASSPIFIEDSPAQSIQEIRANARRLKTEKDIQLIIIDYLQISKSTTKQALDNRSREVGEISAGCKHLARELKIPLLVLSQIDRSVEKNQRRARLSDLRESGAIENDADTVLFLSRDEFYAESDEEKEAAEGKATLAIAKQRSGPIGDVYLTFLKEFTRFETRAREHPPAEQNQGALI